MDEEYQKSEFEEAIDKKLYELSVNKKLRGLLLVTAVILISINVSVLVWFR